MNFENTRIKEILHPNVSALASVGLQTTVSELLDQLIIHKTDALLVRTSDSTIYGFVDALDLGSWLCTVLETPIVSNAIGESRSIASDNDECLEKRTRMFKDQAVSNIVAMSRRNFYHKLGENSLIGEAIDLFKKGCHRIAVTSAVDNSVIGVLSQIDLLSWACENPSYFPSEKSSKELSMLHCEKCDHLRTISKNNKAFEAFLLMNQKRVSSLPVVDGGKLLGNFCISDIKALHGQDLSILLNTVEDFVTGIRSATGKPTSHAVCCNPNATLLEAVKHMCKERVNRVFVCTESCSPVCVFSMTDIFDQLKRTESHHHHQLGSE